MRSLTNIIIISAVVFFFGVLFLYFSKIIAFFQSISIGSDKAYQMMLGRRLRSLQGSLEHHATLNKKSYLARADRYLQDIIVNLDMAKDGVTTIGLFFFILSISIISGVVVSVFSTLFLGLLTILASFYFTLTVIRFLSLMRFEKREASIMDTVDLLSMDISAGVQNAIERYTPVLNVSMQPYFRDFLDNIKFRGFGFEEAMLILSDRLGVTFYDFAHKAIVFEKRGKSKEVKGGKDQVGQSGGDMVELFSAIIEVNRYRRQLRFEANKRFSSLRVSFLLSGAIIAGYGIFAIITDPYIRNFFLHRDIGTLVLILDSVIVSGVLSYMASIKAKL